MVVDRMYTDRFQRGQLPLFTEIVGDSCKPVKSHVTRHRSLEIKSTGQLPLGPPARESTAADSCGLDLV